MVTFVSKDRARIYGARGGSVLSAQLLCIEGEYVTLQQIADRLGVSGVKRASQRLRDARKRVAVVTWASLGLKE